jgi:hypothetical protein
MMRSHPRLPARLDALPRLYFTSRPAQTLGQLQNPEKAYGVRSASQLVEEFERREARLRDIAVQRQADRQVNAFAVLVAAAILALLIGTSVWLHFHAS